MNRQFMPDADVTSWTPLEHVAEWVCTVSCLNYTKRHGVKEVWGCSQCSNLCQWCSMGLKSSFSSLSSPDYLLPNQTRQTVASWILDIVASCCYRFGPLGYSEGIPRQSRVKKRTHIISHNGDGRISAYFWIYRASFSPPVPAYLCSCLLLIQIRAVPTIIYKII